MSEGTKALPTIIATSVVRGSQQGESHGGVYLVDFEHQDARIMVDANFGYDGRLDLLEDFIRETLPANLYWMEEMVTADVGDYRVLRRTRDRLGSNALLVCGEVDTDPPSPVFVDLVKAGLIDGFQPDCTATGFSRWQALEEWLEPTGVRSVPRNFGNGTFGTRAELVFGAASQTFLMLEDERFRLTPKGLRFADAAAAEFLR